MGAQNKDLEAYLKYYLDFEQAPRFAVLVKGPWGVGKTHFVNRFLASRLHADDQPRANCLYVSLYGITDWKQVEDAFFQQLHPVLSSKGMKVAASVVKGLLKTTVKIDLDNLGAKGATVTSEFPDMEIPDYLRSAGDRALIFDDLERCSLSIKDTLGYINSFVEHDGCRVILIANEDEILRHAESKAYLQLKEKLIGKTFEVRAELDQALGEFIARINTVELRQFYTIKRSDIEALFAQSGTENLRILQQTMWDFERFFGALTDTHRKNNEAMAVMLRLFFALSFELKIGRLTNEEFLSLGERNWFDILDEENTDKTPIQRLEKRYAEVDFNQTLLSWNILGDILLRSIVDVISIRESLDRHKYFVGPTEEPAWRVLWDARSREDAEIDAALTRVEKEWAERQFVQPGTILHVCGIWLWFSRIDLLTKTKDSIILEVKRYIEDIYTAKRLAVPVQRELDLDGPIQSGGLAFHEGETPEFKDVRNHLLTYIRRAIEDSYPQKAHDLMNEMSASPDLFVQRINSTNSEENRFDTVPILVHVKPQEFIDRVFALTRDYQRTVFVALRSRYDFDRLNGRLQPEAAWLRSVCDDLERRLSSVHPVSREVVRSFVVHLRRLVDASKKLGPTAADCT